MCRLLLDRDAALEGNSYFQLHAPVVHRLDMAHMVAVTPTSLREAGGSAHPVFGQQDRHSQLRA